MMKDFFLRSKNRILLVILLVVSGMLAFTPRFFHPQKHSFLYPLYLATLLLRIIVLPVFGVSLISLIVLGVIKITRLIKLSVDVFLILVFLLALAILYIPPLLLGFKSSIPKFDPLKPYTIVYNHPLNTQIDYVIIDYLSREAIRIEIQTSLNRYQRYQDKLNYNEFAEIITALNELRDKSRYSLIACPVKFFSSYGKNSRLDINGVSFFFHPEKRFLFEILSGWCYTFPKLENNLYRIILNLVNKELPGEADKQAPRE